MLGDRRATGSRHSFSPDFHSICTPLALIGPLQRAISPATNFEEYSGVRRSAVGISSPIAPKRSRTDGRSSALMKPSLSFFSPGAGVFFGGDRGPAGRGP